MELYPYFISYVILLVSGGIMGILLLIRISWMRSVPGAYGLMLSIFCVTEWSLTYTLEIIRLDMAEKIFWAKLEYFGISYAALGIFIFAMRYSGRGEWFTRLRIAVLASLAAVGFLAALTNDWHRQIWAEIKFTNGLPFGPLAVTHGDGFLFVVAYQYALMLASTIIFFQIAFRSQRLYRNQSYIMLAGTSFPWIANIMYLTGVNPFPSLDLTPIALTASNLFLSINFLRYRFMDLQPVAHDSVFNAMSDGVVVLDVKERIVDINPVGTFIFQNTANFIGRDIASLLPQWRAWKSAHPRGEINQELPIEILGEPLTFKLRTTPVIDQSGRHNGRVLLITDITDQKRAREQLEETSRLKSQLLASFGHDLRSPLGAIIGYTEMIKDGSFGPVSSEQDKACAEVLDSSNQLLSFINNLVGQAQMETGRIVLKEFPFNVEDVVGPLLSTLNFHAHKKGLELIEYVDPGLPRTMIGDQFWLRQIVLNLVHNAVKFTDKGSVTVRFIKVNEKQWAIQVIDTGMGIPEDAQKRVFEAFEQVSNVQTSKQSGFGLGLSIVAKLTSVMSGKIDLKSDPGKGSAFTVILPLKSAD